MLQRLVMKMMLQDQANPTEIQMQVILILFYHEVTWSPWAENNCDNEQSVTNCDDAPVVSDCDDVSVANDCDAVLDIINGNYVQNTNDNCVASVVCDRDDASVAKDVDVFLVPSNDNGVLEQRDHDVVTHGSNVDFFLSTKDT